MQKRRNSIANALDLPLFDIKPLIYYHFILDCVIARPYSNIFDRFHYLLQTTVYPVVSGEDIPQFNPNHFLMFNP